MFSISFCLTLRVLTCYAYGVLEPVNTPLPTLVNQAKPWARQPFDTDALWPWFLEFMCTPHPRSLDLMVQKYGNGVQVYARRYAWFERAAAYDNFIVAEHNRNLQLFTLEAAKRNANLWETITRESIEIVSDQISKYLKMCREQAMPGQVKIGDVIKLAEMAFKLEQLRTGGATERVEIGPVKEAIDQMSYEEIEGLRTLQAKLLEGKK